MTVALLQAALVFTAGLFCGVFMHRAPVPSPDDEPFEDEVPQPIPQRDPVPDPNPEQGGA